MNRLSCRVASPILALYLGACGATDTTAPPRFSSLPASAHSLTSVVSEPDVAGTLLLEDDFSRATLNWLKWKISTDIPAWGAPEVFIEGRRVLFKNRGHLITVAEFPPQETGGIRITGEWTYGLQPGDDFLQVLTRSDGLPDPDNLYGETHEGVEFYAAQLWGPANIMSIVGRGGALGTITDLSTPGSLVLGSGRTYRFDIRDDGRNLRFTMTDALDPAQTRTITAKSVFLGSSNHVVFHNRDGSYFDRKSFLDHVRIRRGFR